MIEVFKLLGLRIIPSNQWTLAKKGSKQVGVVGIEDKREITGVLAVNMAGELLPPQIIYSGTTERYSRNRNFHIPSHVRPCLLFNYNTHL